MESFYNGGNQEILDAYLAKINANRTDDYGDEEDEEEYDPYKGMSPEEMEKYDKISTIRSSISTSIFKTNKRKPFIDEIVRDTYLEPSEINSLLSEYKIEHLVDRTYTSSYIADINKLFPADSVNDSYVIPGYTVDLYYKKFNIAIDVNNTYDTNLLTIGKKNMQKKVLAANNAGIRLINIFDYELFYGENRTRIYNLLQDILEKPALQIGARKTTVQLIDYRVARDFLSKYHVQGTATASVYVGCFYKQELIGVMSFGKPRFSDSYEYEIVRMAWKTGVKVSGGTNKMFKFFLTEINPDSVITYADINKFTGNGYLRLGFNFVRLTEPDYMWVRFDGSEALTRYRCQKHRLIEKGLGTKDETEDIIMYRQGYNKVYGCGNIILDWRKGRKSKNEQTKINLEDSKSSKQTKSQSTYKLDSFI